MKPDIYYFLDIALNKSKTPTNRLNKAMIALEHLTQIIDYLQSIKTNTNGQTEQKTESRKTKSNSISARNKRVRQADTISPTDRASNGV